MEATKELRSALMNGPSLQVSPALGITALNTISRYDNTLRRVLGTHFTRITDTIRGTKAVANSTVTPAGSSSSVLGKTKSSSAAGDAPPSKRIKLDGA